MIVNSFSFAYLHKWEGGKERKGEGGRVRDRELFLHFPNNHSSHNLSRPMLRARNYIWVSHMGGGDSRTSSTASTASQQGVGLEALHDAMQISQVVA